MFELLGFDVRGVCLTRDGESLARTEVFVAIADEAVFDAILRGGLEDLAIDQSQRYVLALLAGRVAESICLGTTFDPERFTRDTFWEDGEAVAPERLPPSWLQHTDRDKAHIMGERILRLRPTLAKSVAEHLRASWELTDRALNETWPAVARVGEALLGATTGRLSRARLAGLIHRGPFHDLSESWSRQGAARAGSEVGDADAPR
jgi:hypothetical protein